MNNYNIFATGIGGQGILSISNILCIAGVKQGLKVRGSETHGMSQRFGSVFSTVRYGDIFSPLVAERSADVYIGSEPVEAIRYAKFIKNSGYVIVNRNPIPSPTSIVSKIPYPDLNKIHENLQQYTESNRILYFNATELAIDLGAAIVQNIILLGACAAIPDFPISRDNLIEALKVQLKEKVHEINIKAFNIGYDRMKAIIN